MADSPEIGDLFAEKYRVEAILGKGAMAMVLGARHLGLDEPVAIKVLHSKMLSEPGMVERFVREARAASKIKSEHVVRVTDVDMLRSGVPYMIMERLVGSDLASVCQEHKQLPVEEAVGYVLDACEALAEAHALGIIHRDLKPANLFLARRKDGTTLVKVLDFGISKVTPQIAGEQLVSTGAGAILGSPSYMSPEQMASARDVDTRTDIWALGAILYRLVTGELPFRAVNARQLVSLVLKAKPQPPRELCPELPEALEAVILRCLEKDRQRRFPTATALSEALTPFVSGRNSVRKSALALPDDVLPSEAASLRRKAQLRVAAAIGVLLLLGSVVVLSLRSSANGAPAAPTSEPRASAAPGEASPPAGNATHGPTSEPAGSAASGEVAPPAGNATHGPTSEPAGSASQPSPKSFALPPVTNRAPKPAAPR